MAPPHRFRAEAICAISPRFKKESHKLNLEAHVQLLNVLYELLSGTLTPGRHLEKLSGHDALYSVRLNKKQRMVFTLDPDRMIRLVAVGNHDAAYYRS